MDGDVDYVFETRVCCLGQPDANVRQLCRRFGISPTTGYRWTRRYREEALAGLANRSRRPCRSPARTAKEVEAAVVAIRREHRAWDVPLKRSTRPLAINHNRSFSSHTAKPRSVSFSAASVGPKSA